MLHELPNELLSSIVGFLDRPKSVLSLSLTCHKLDEFVRLDGWKAFLRGRLGLAVPLHTKQSNGLSVADARNIVHGTTTLYRNWNRKAFVARCLNPEGNVVSLSTWEAKQWIRPRGQTMGYQPSIDSYDEHPGGQWGSRREVLVWSAGKQIVMRIRGTRPGILSDSSDRGEQVRSDRTDDFGFFSSWYTWEHPDSVEGRDDITALKVFRPDNCRGRRDGTERIAFGTASGDLSILHADIAERDARAQEFDTQHRSVGSLSLSPGAGAFLLASLSNSTLALYPIEENEGADLKSRPSSEMQVLPPGTRDGRIWSANFIAADKVALGLGPSFEPLQVYEITPTGYSARPIRKFGINELHWAGRADHAVSAHANPRLKASIYPVVPVTPHTFLSGGYDGIVRLHDMRSHRGYEAIYMDATNDSPVFSLQTQGQERLIVGTAMHNMIKVFDLRLSGTCAYDTMQVPSSQARSVDSSTRTGSAAKPKKEGKGWNLFLSNRLGVIENSSRGGDSPVYSLSLPSPTSPFLYAGIEDSVFELAFTSVVDRHPDPLFTPTLSYRGADVIDFGKTWDPRKNVVSMSMYQWNDERAGLGIKFWRQRRVNDTEASMTEQRSRGESASMERNAADLDERWSDPARDPWGRGRETISMRRENGGSRRNNRGRRRGRGAG